MQNLQLTKAPEAKTGMLIRKPVAQVFDAFIHPEITTKFWFTKSTGPLEPGAKVEWNWEMYGVSVPVTVKAIEPNRRLRIEWPGHEGSIQTVEWIFTSHDAHSTFVEITVAGFAGTGDEVVRQVMDTMEGFSFVLAGLKALLEHDVRLNLVGDRFPQGIEQH
jgi:uncharacterized protein YndB with AHSA1/START domain